jgi:cytidylate kinase
MTSFIIAIDGDAASGKGTLGRSLASKLGFAFMDTGALYRIVAWRALEAGVNPDDAASARGMAEELYRNYRPEESGRIELRHEAVSQATSRIAVHPEVRAALLDLQRRFALNPPLLPGGAQAQGAVLDGRDIGTVVCPDAHLKLYVTARPEIRAQRRHKELQSRGVLATYEAVLAEMRERDARDSQRATAPLKPAPDAVMLDTSDMTVDEALETALAHASQRMQAASQP